MTRESKNCIGLVRVSSYEQAQRNLSIPNQIEQIQSYCNQNDYNLIKIFKEEHSAFKGKRIIFDEMIDYIKKHKINFIIVFRIDRISRSAEGFLKLDKVIKDRGVSIISLTEPLQDTYLGNHMKRNIESMAILYSEELSFKTKLGIRKKLQQGGNIFGTPPFGTKRINGYLVPDENKIEIVKYIFKEYSKGVLGYKNLAKDVRERFGIKKFTRKQVNHTLNNTIYYGYITKRWELNKDECIFWGYDKAGIYIETYKLNYVTPIITKNLFDKCQNIKKKNLNFGNQSAASKSKYPNIFKCICGRSLRRGDRKGIRYFRCGKEINGKFPSKCLEPHIQVKDIEVEIENIIRTIIPDDNLTKVLKKEIQNRIKNFDIEKKEKITETISEINKNKLKLTEITESFVNDKISKDIFEQVCEGINGRNEFLSEQLTMYENNEKFIDGGYKLLEFIDLLKYYENKLNTDNYEKKSSRAFSIIFSISANVILSQKKVHTYALLPPFEYFKNINISVWGGGRDLNPRQLESQSSTLPTELQSP